MASQKLTALTALATPLGEDLMYVVDDPSGTPASRKITLASLLSAQLLIENLGTNWNKYALGFGRFRNTRRLTHAQITDLPTTPLDFIATPGSGFAIWPRQTIVISDPWAANYTNVNGAANCRVDYSSELMQNIGSFVSGGDVFAFLGSGILANIGSIDHNIDFYAGQAAQVSGLDELENLEMQILVNNQGSGVFTGGNAANEFLVMTDYTILNLNP